MLWAFTLKKKKTNRYKTRKAEARANTTQVTFRHTKNKLINKQTSCILKCWRCLLLTTSRYFISEHCYIWNILGVRGRTIYFNGSAEIERLCTAALYHNARILGIFITGFSVPLFTSTTFLFCYHNVLRVSPSHDTSHLCKLPICDGISQFSVWGACFTIDFKTIQKFRDVLIILLQNHITAASTKIRTNL